jgi:hypothetical protein
MFILSTLLFAFFTATAIDGVAHALGKEETCVTRTIVTFSVNCVDAIYFSVCVACHELLYVFQRDLSIERRRQQVRSSLKKATIHTEFPNCLASSPRNVHLLSQVLDFVTDASLVQHIKPEFRRTTEFAQDFAAKCIDLPCTISFPVVLAYLCGRVHKPPMSPNTAIEIQYSDLLCATPKVFALIGDSNDPVTMPLRAPVLQHFSLYTTKRASAIFRVTTVVKHDEDNKSQTESDDSDYNPDDESEEKSESDDESEEENDSDKENDEPNPLRPVDSDNVFDIVDNIVRPPQTPPPSPEETQESEGESDAESDAELDANTNNGDNDSYAETTDTDTDVLHLCSMWLGDDLVGNNHKTEIEYIKRYFAFIARDTMNNIGDDVDLYNEKIVSLSIHIKYAESSNEEKFEDINLVLDAFGWCPES